MPPFYITRCHQLYQKDQYSIIEQSSTYSYRTIKSSIFYGNIILSHMHACNTQNVYFPGGRPRPGLEPLVREYAQQ